MVVKTPVGARISALHHAMLAELCHAYGMNEGDLIGILVDRAWHSYRRANRLSTVPTLTASGAIANPGVSQEGAQEEGP